jgi:hypothetical protein
VFLSAQDFSYVCPVARANLAATHLGRRPHSRKLVARRDSGSWSELPEDFEFFVQAEFLVASDHRDLFAHSLGDDLAVERVSVV